VGGGEKIRYQPKEKKKSIRKKGKPYFPQHEGLSITSTIEKANRHKGGKPMAGWSLKDLSSLF